MSDVFIARQPIFDRQNQVFAYELLWRQGNGNAAQVTDGNLATTQVILNALTEIGLDRLVGNQSAFINLTRSFLLGEQPLPDMNGRLVLEVLEDIEPDAEIISAVARLSQQGYTIALDDFLYRPELAPLVEQADIIKIDLLAQDEATLREHVATLQRYPVKLLAEKVETRAEYDTCLELGFEYFQGYFFARPHVVQGRRPPTNKLAILQLLAQLQDPATTDSELETLIIRDVTLSYRLLRYINSAQFNMSREIESIRQAIMLLGRKTLSQLANLLVMSRIEDKPRELMMTALIRARMSETLGQRLGVQDESMYFTAGLFSIIDALLDQPMPDLLDELPLADELKQALLAQQGPLGEVLGCVVAYDEGRWEKAVHPRIDANSLRETYLDAIDWAGDTNAVIAMGG